MTNPCEGCETYVLQKGKQIRCSVYQAVHKHGLHCPCMDCLIKTMCTVGCEERKKLSKQIMGWRI